MIEEKDRIFLNQEEDTPSEPAPGSEGAREADAGKEEDKKEGDGGGEEPTPA